MPPLRDRRADIPHLVRHFMARVPSGRGAPPRINAISASALAMLEAYDWPGNIRQLENAIFRASVLCDGDVLTEEEFPQIRAQVEGTVDLDRGNVPPTRIQPEPADDSLLPSAPAPRPSVSCGRSTSAAMSGRSPTSSWR